MLFVVFGLGLLAEWLPIWQKCAQNVHCKTTDISV